MPHLSDDLMWYIYKLYFSNNVISAIKNAHDCYENKKYFKNTVLKELVHYSTGDYVSKLINVYISENPKHYHVINFTEEYWDEYYYFLLDAHVYKIFDLFLFTNFKDAIQTLYT